MLEELKKTSITFRKTAMADKTNVVASEMAKFSGFLISQIENVGKNNGNRKTTDDEAVKVVMKTLATLEESFKIAPSPKTLEEITFCRSILPVMVSDEEVIEVLKNAEFDKTAKGAKGVIIGLVKSHFQGRPIDMKRVNTLIAEVCGV